MNDVLTPDRMRPIPADAAGDAPAPPKFEPLPMNLVDALVSARYSVASTMPYVPHHYTVLRDWDGTDGRHDADTFRQVAYLVTERGVRRRYYSMVNPYLEVNGYKYWTMDDDPADVTLVNRAAKLHGVDYRGEPESDSTEAAFYAAVAIGYDAMFSWGDDLEDSKRYCRMAAPQGDVLDIGCGTGRLVDFRGNEWKLGYRYELEPARYVGIDPSPGMLGVFAAKHPEFGGSLVRTAFEDYWTTRRFDTIVGMFGSPSYAQRNADVVAKCDWLLKPGGRAFLMFYADAPRGYGRFRERFGVDAAHISRFTYPASAEVEGEYGIVKFVKKEL